MKVVTEEIKDLPPGKFSFTPTSTIIEKEGIREIKELVKPAILDRNYDWSFKNKRGSLAKRIRKTCYKSHGIKLSDNIISEIGNIASKHYIEPTEYTMDITKNFNWEAGDFGDRSSCFWQGRSQIRKDMEIDGRFSALRFFSKTNTLIKSPIYNGYIGIARSWIMKTTLSKKVNKNLKKKTKAYCLFNAYGPMVSYKQASIFSNYTGLPFVKVKLNNGGNMYGGLYFNGDSFLFGNPEIIKDYKVIDVSMEENLYKNSREDHIHSEMDALFRAERTLQDEVELL